MEKRLIAFMVLAFLCIMVNFWFTYKFVKPPARAVAASVVPEDLTSGGFVVRMGKARAWHAIFRRASRLRASAVLAVAAPGLCG